MRLKGKYMPVLRSSGLPDDLIVRDMFLSTFGKYPTPEGGIENTGIWCQTRLAPTTNSQRQQQLNRP